MKMTSAEKAAFDIWAYDVWDIIGAHSGLYAENTDVMECIKGLGVLTDDFMRAVNGAWIRDIDLESWPWGDIFYEGTRPKMMDVQNALASMADAVNAYNGTAPTEAERAKAVREAVEAEHYARPERLAPWTTLERVTEEVLGFRDESEREYAEVLEYCTELAQMPLPAAYESAIRVVCKAAFAMHKLVSLYDGEDVTTPFAQFVLTVTDNVEQVSGVHVREDVRHWYATT